MLTKRTPVVILLSLIITACSYSDGVPTGVGDPTSTSTKSVDNTPTTVVPSATPNPTPSPAYAPPSGFKDYIDPSTDITISIPEGWWITGETPGEYAILQSYHPDKYVGGEEFQPEDTKCDLKIFADNPNPESILSEWTADGRTEILDRKEVKLPSGVSTIRVEMKSMGTSRAQITQLGGQTTSLVCFGDLDPFESIADSLR